MGGCLKGTLVLSFRPKLKKITDMIWNKNFVWFLGPSLTDHNGPSEIGLDKVCPVFRLQQDLGLKSSAWKVFEFGLVGLWF